MPVASRGVSREFVLDTGPLLCLGGAKSLRGALIRTHPHQTYWVSAVRKELERLARGSDWRSKYAAAVTGRHSGWLGSCIQVDPQNRAELERLHRILRDSAVAKEATRGRSYSSHPAANLGEAESILHAKLSGRHFVANDNDALKIARVNNVTSLNLTMLAKYLVARGGRASEIAGELMTLQRSKIDTGAIIRGPLDLSPRGK